jgi:hypothetical protein
MSVADLSGSEGLTLALAMITMKASICVRRRGFGEYRVNDVLEVLLLQFLPCGCEFTLTLGCRRSRPRTSETNPQDSPSEGCC